MSSTLNFDYDPAWQITLDDLTTGTTNDTFPDPTPASRSLQACEKCRREFDAQDDLQKHRDAHRRGEVRYWCIPRCGKGYTTGAELQTHQARCREIVVVRYFDPTFVPPPIVAVPNHTTSAGTTDMDTAARREPRGAKRHSMKCKCCPREFRTGALLMEHLAVHESGVQNFVCPTSGCGRVYTTARDLRAHQVKSQGGCGSPQPPSSSTAQASDAPTERQHYYRLPRSAVPPPVVAVPNHTTSAGTTDTDTTAPRESGGPKRQLTAKCNCCTRSFRNRALLAEHLAVHMSGVPIVCPNPGCGKAYATERDLKFHLTKSGCGGPWLAPSVSAAQASDAQNERVPDCRQPRPGASSSAVNPLFVSDSGEKVLQDWQLQALEDSFRKNAYPVAEEVQRLQKEFWLNQDIVRRWFMSRRRAVH